MDRTVFPPCCLTWGQTMMEVMKIMLTSYNLKSLLEGTNKTLCAPGPRRKELTIQETEPDLPVSLQKSLQDQGHWLQQSWNCWPKSFWKRSALPPLPYLRFNLRPNYSPTHQQKIGLKIYWAWPHPLEQDPVSPTVSLTHQEASINLFLTLSLRGQTEWKTESQKTNQTDHMDQGLV